MSQAMPLPATPPGDAEVLADHVVVDLPPLTASVRAAMAPTRSAFLYDHVAASNTTTWPFNNQVFGAGLPQDAGLPLDATEPRLLPELARADNLAVVHHAVSCSVPYRPGTRGRRHRSGSVVAAPVRAARSVVGASVFCAASHTAF